MARPGVDCVPAGEAIVNPSALLTNLAGFAHGSALCVPFLALNCSRFHRLQVQERARYGLYEQGMTAFSWNVEAGRSEFSKSPKVLAMPTPTPSSVGSTRTTLPLEHSHIAGALGLKGGRSTTRSSWQDKKGAAEQAITNTPLVLMSRQNPALSQAVCPSSTQRRRTGISNANLRALLRSTAGLAASIFADGQPSGSA